MSVCASSIQSPPPPLPPPRMTSRGGGRQSPTVENPQYLQAWFDHQRVVGPVVQPRSNSLDDDSGSSGGMDTSVELVPVEWTRFDTSKHDVRESVIPFTRDGRLSGGGIGVNNNVPYVNTRIGRCGAPHSIGHNAYSSNKTNVTSSPPPRITFVDHDRNASLHTKQLNCLDRFVPVPSFAGSVQPPPPPVSRVECENSQDSYSSEVVLLPTRRKLSHKLSRKNSGAAENGRLTTDSTSSFRKSSVPLSRSMSDSPCYLSTRLATKSPPPGHTTRSNEDFSTSTGVPPLPPRDYPGSNSSPRPTLEPSPEEVVPLSFAPHAPTVRSVESKTEIHPIMRDGKKLSETHYFLLESKLARVPTLPCSTDPEDYTNVSTAQNDSTTLWQDAALVINARPVVTADNKTSGRFSRPRLPCFGSDHSSPILSRMILLPCVSDRSRRRRSRSRSESEEHLLCPSSNSSAAGDSTDQSSVDSFYNLSYEMDRSSLGGGSETDRGVNAGSLTQHGVRERFVVDKSRLAADTIDYNNITEEQYHKIETLFQLEVVERRMDCLLALEENSWNIERAASSLMDHKSSRV